MKYTTLIPTLAALLFTVACSKVQTTSVLAEKWDTGQHRSCLYGHSRLYCGKPEEITAFRPPVTPYKLELLRPELVKDSRTDGGSYATKFTSHTPMDFSTWDCYKTGMGSPAIVCDLKHRPTKEESDAFVKSEKEQQEQSRLEQVASNQLMQSESSRSSVGAGSTDDIYNKMADDNHTSMPQSKWNQLVAAAIEHHCPWVGMTKAEVEAAIGKPQKDDGWMWEYERTTKKENCQKYVGENCAVETVHETATFKFSPNGYRLPASNADEGGWLWLNCFSKPSDSGSSFYDEFGRYDEVGH